MRIFISCVSTEFRGYRNFLSKSLASPSRDIKVQEDFADGPGTLLEKLDDYISRCQAVIHLVGHGAGARAKPAEVRSIIKRHCDFKQELPEIGVDIGSEQCPLTYTQWEALLAIYHRVPCFIYLADSKSVREDGWLEDADEFAAQKVHVQRLKDLGQDRRMATFDDARDVAVRFLNGLFEETIVAADSDLSPNGVVDWPALPHEIEKTLADRRPEFDIFAGMVTGSTERRAFLISGPSDRGKSVLLEQFVNVARKMPPLMCGRASFKPSVSLPEILWDLTQELNTVRFPRFEREFDRRANETSRTAFLRDLADARVPVLLVLDAFEQASLEAQKWIEERLLPVVARRTALRLILAGQRVPVPEPGSLWGPLSEHTELALIHEPGDWRDYSHHIGLSSISHDNLVTLVRAAEGSPRAVSGLLASLKRQDQHGV